MQEISPVQQLLDQWLLLPLFASLGLAVLLLRSARGRAGLSLAALLSFFALRNLAEAWPEMPGSDYLAVVSASLVPPLVLLFVLSYLGGRRLAGSRAWRLFLPLAPGLLFTGAALLAGWPPSHPAFLVCSLAFFAPAAALLAFSGPRGILSSDEPFLFGAGLTLLFLSGPVYDTALPLAGLRLPLFPYASAAAGALLAWAVLQYKSFGASPSAEENLPGGPALEAGLFLESGGDRGQARSLFLSAVRHGTPGLLLTRAHPATLRRRTGLRKVEVLRLAQSSYEKCLPPGKLDVLSHLLRDFAGECGRTVVLIEDLDYLVTNAGHHRTLDFLVDLGENAGEAGMTVLLGSDLLTEEERGDIKGLGIRSLAAYKGT